MRITIRQESGKGRGRGGDKNGKVTRSYVSENGKKGAAAKGGGESLLPQKNIKNEIKCVTTLWRATYIRSFLLITTHQYNAILTVCILSSQKIISNVYQKFQQCID